MSFNVFKSHEKNQPEGYKQTMGIKEVVMKLSYLANLRTIVIKNFDTILAHSDPSEFRYFLMHEEWKRLFLEHAEEVFGGLDCMYDFHSTIHIFPELAHDGYLYLLKNVLNRTDDFFFNTLDLPNDILIPMSAIERTSEYRFSIIREKAHEILDATSDYTEFYHAIYVLENYFNVPSELLKTSANALLEKEISLWISSNERDYSDTSILEDFFQSVEAYNLFKDNLEEILNKHGIYLYAALIKLVGPDPEILKAQYACPELYPEA